MIKFKWWFPLTPFIGVFLSDPHVQFSRESRWLYMLGALLLTGILLVIVRPWSVDEERRAP